MSIREFRWPLFPSTSLRIRRDVAPIMLKFIRKIRTLNDYSYTGYVRHIRILVKWRNMMDHPKPSKPFPKREKLPYSHQPDLDGRTDYGRDGETTHKD